MLIGAINLSFKKQKKNAEKTRCLHYMFFERKKCNYG
jgi:hypothetical protein